MSQKQKKKIIVCKLPPINGSGERNSKHHRRAKANGGAGIKGNISKVPVPKHHAWHYFFNDRNGVLLSAEKIAARLPILHAMIENFFSKEGQMIPLAELIIEINRVWLDPAYEIVLNEEDQNFR